MLESHVSTRSRGSLIHQEKQGRAASKKTKPREKKGRTQTEKKTGKTETNRGRKRAQPKLSSSEHAQCPFLVTFFFAFFVIPLARLAAFLSIAHFKSSRKTRLSLPCFWRQLILRTTDFSRRLCLTSPRACPLSRTKLSLQVLPSLC